MIGRRQPLLFVVSGPSGSGKGEALRCIAEETDVARVVTYTSRPPRPQEREGIDYHFVSGQRFSELAEAGHLLEVNRTYGTHAYGSPRSLLDYSEQTPDEAMEMDPEGFLYLRANSIRQIVGIFVCPRSIEQLDERISARSRTLDLSNRLATARRQIRLAPMYDFVIPNDGSLETFRAQILGLVRSLQADAAGRSLVARLSDEIWRLEANTVE